MFVTCQNLMTASFQVFIRELISNGSDALEKLRYKLITGGGDSETLEIHLQTDVARGILTIQVCFNCKDVFSTGFNRLFTALCTANLIRMLKNITLGHWHWDE